MNRTKIEWTDVTWNPVTGCLHGCSYCYARRLAKRLAGRYGYPVEDSFKPTLHLDKINEPAEDNSPKLIFVVSMGDLFGKWASEEWIKRVLRAAETAPWHTYQFLTKNPARYKEFSFPEGAWLGTTIDRANQERLDHLKMFTNATGPVRKFVSIEPILEDVSGLDFEGIDYLFVGPDTSKGAAPPPVEWLVKLAERFPNKVYFKKKAIELMKRECGHEV